MPGEEELKLSSQAEDHAIRYVFDLAVSQSVDKASGIGTDSAPLDPQQGIRCSSSAEQPEAEEIGKRKNEEEKIKFTVTLFEKAQAILDQDQASKRRELMVDAKAEAAAAEASPAQAHPFMMTILSLDAIILERVTSHSKGVAFLADSFARCSRLMHEPIQGDATAVDDDDDDVIRREIARCVARAVQKRCISFTFMALQNPAMLPTK